MHTALPQKTTPSKEERKMNNYIAPAIEIIELQASDVITTSGGFDLPEIPLGQSSQTVEDI